MFLDAFNFDLVKTIFFSEDTQGQAGSGAWSVSALYYPASNIEFWISNFRILSIFKVRFDPNFGLKAHFKLFLGIFFHKIIEMKLWSNILNEQKQNGTKLDIKILRPSPQQKVLYVSGFGGGIKKKHSPTLEFEVYFFHTHLSHFLNENVSKLFLFVKQEKFGNIFIQKVSVKESFKTSNSKVGECFF